MHLQLRTDDRVRRVVEHFARRSDWTILGAIDSANYGEGYDLIFGTVPVRIYDDQRSDEVALRTARQQEPTDWERAMTMVACEMAGTVWLHFEVDRFNEVDAQDRVRAVEHLRNVLSEAGYHSDDMRIDSG